MAEIKDMFKKAMSQAKHLAGKDEDEFDDLGDEGFGEEPGLGEEGPGEPEGFGEKPEPGLGAPGAKPEPKEPGVGEEGQKEFGEEEDEEFGAGHEEEPEPEPKPAPTVALAPAQTFEGVERLSAEISTIRSKLDLLQTHLQNIESREELAHSEAQQFLQQLSFITQKLDSLEQEHSELERLIKGSA